jgi:1-acyl-sn-glycerol-3-phosphate acyltransferase
MMVRALRALWRMLCVTLHVLRGWVILLGRFPRLTLSERQAEVQAWSAHLLSILGLQIKVQGKFPPPSQSVLVVANHVSWLDVAALHAVMPQARFVSKADVHHWPIIGGLCVAARTLFIERERKRDALRVVHEMVGALTEGDTVAVFPEGTTTDGHTLRPFHANLLQAAISAGRPVQPVALRFTDAVHAISPVVEYTGDISLLGSLCRLLWASELQVSLVACELIESAHRERRDLARLCQSSIQRQLDAEGTIAAAPADLDLSSASLGRRVA